MGSRCCVTKPVTLFRHFISTRQNKMRKILFQVLLPLLATPVLSEPRPYKIEDTDTSSTTEDRGQFELLMPNSKPMEPETYLCTTIRLDTNNTYYITGFNPKADMGTAHHMLLFGCEAPGQKEELFSCGEMGRILPGTKQAAPCSRGQKILYAWARNAPKLDLPPDVGFKVGGDGDVKYLVLQVHYAAVDKIPETGDTSGVVLSYTDQPQPKQAGVYFLGTNGMIPARSTTYMEAACTINTDLTIHPFAFRTHTHALGRVVSGWKVTKDMEWSLIGKEDPQKPQMFYPVEDAEMTLSGGDTVAARCTMVSYRDRITWVGATAEDEMCNFYMMYWVQGQRKLSNERCTSLGPPVYAWDRWLVGGGLSNIPDDASSLL